MTETKATRNLNVPMTDEKKIEIVEELSRIQLEIEEIENAKKKINPLRDQLTELSRSLKAGVTLEAVECIWAMNDPAPGRKTLYTRFEYEVVETADMTDADSAIELDFNENSEQTEEQLAETEAIEGDIPEEEPNPLYMMKMEEN